MLRDLLYIITFCALAAFSLIFVNQTQKKDALGHQIYTEVLQKLSEDSVYISRNMANILDRNILSTLSASPFGIEIYRSNQLIWWNEVVRQLPRNKQARYVVLQQADFQIVIRTELNRFNTYQFATSPFPEEEGVKYQAKISFKGIDYLVSDNSDNKTSLWIGMMFLLWVVVMSLFYRLVRKHPDNVWVGLAFILFILLLRLLFTFPPADSLTGQFWVFKVVSDGWWVHSLFTFGLDTLLIWLLAFGNVLNKPFFPVQNRSFIPPVGTASFVLSLYFIYLNLCLKNLADGNSVFADVSNPGFFSVTSIFVLILLIINVFAGFILLHKFFSAKNENKSKSNNSFLAIIAGILCSFPVFYWADIEISVLLYYLFLLAVALIFDAYVELKEQKLTYALWWMLLFSGFLATGFFHYEQIKANSDRELFAKNHFFSATTTDVKQAEDIKKNLDTSGIFLILGNIEYPAKWDKDEIKDLFGGLIPSPDINFDIELFDKNGFSLFANHFGNYHQLKKALQTSTLVGENNLFFQPMTETFYIKYELQPESHPDGPWLFVLAFHPKEIKHEIKRDISYALLKSDFVIDKQIYQQNGPTDVVLRTIRQNGINGNFVYTRQENNLGYTLLVFEPKSGLLKPISIFSFLFALTGILVFILTWTNTKFTFLPDSLPLRMGERSSLKTKIQLSIILLIIFSFLVIGAVTAFYFYNLIQANQVGKEREETQILANAVIQESRDKESEKEVINHFYRNLLNLSYVHSKDVQLYDKEGKLLATSTGGPVEYMMPAYEVSGIRDDIKDSSHSANRHFDYIPLLDNQNHKVGFIGVQHQYTNLSTRSIVAFLGTMLNVYIFLFLIAGVIAITIANSITQPIAILAEKLKKFTLGRSNEYLEWNSNDEIGTLITEYNNLNEALTRSAETLAKTERDMAWREMAKQVAHEIKNPLTPMKLSIQYLEKTAREDPERAKDMIPRVSNTLIEQIDNLSQIAAEFSNFASMPQATNEKVALNDLVVAIHDLFRKRDDMDISLHTPIDDLVVFADKNHLVRILNNLVKNATQAIPDNRRGKIDISLYKENNRAVVRVSDNGAGIPESMRDKVFAPNFTTKSSGTGLGLAISANMIESFNGKIYFESQENVGTQFFISIPLMKTDETDRDLRVSLDE